MILLNNAPTLAAQAFPCLGQLPEVVGGTVAETIALQSATTSSAFRSIAIGVSTGVLIWYITRALDRGYGHTRRN